MHIREAEPSDARAIEALYKRFVSNPAIDVRAERIQEIRADPCNFLLVVEDADQLLGTAFLSGGSWPEGRQPDFDRAI